MDKDYLLTTFDNPYDPFEQNSLWLLFDKEQGYNTLEYLARVIKLSPEMTQKEEDAAYINNKCSDIIEKIPELDEAINASTTGWKTTRMNRVDLTILRLATYEIKWDEDVPTGVAINEAVELAKRYSSDQGPSFVNGVLAKVVA